MIEFDPAKDEINERKHGLSLADAADLFQTAHIEMEDSRFDYQERRFIAMGPIQGRLCVCVFTWRGRIRRIISLRKANTRERAAYDQAR